MCWYVRKEISLVRFSMCIVPITLLSFMHLQLSICSGEQQCKRKNVGGLSRPHAHFRSLSLSFPNLNPKLFTPSCSVWVRGYWAQSPLSQVSFFFPPLNYVSLMLMAPQFRYQLFYRQVNNSVFFVFFCMFIHCLLRFDTDTFD